MWEQWTYVAVSSFNYKRMQDNDSFKLVSMYMLHLIIFQFWKLWWYKIEINENSIPSLLRNSLELNWKISPEMKWPALSLKLYHHLLFNALLIINSFAWVFLAAKCYDPFHSVLNKYDQRPNTYLVCQIMWFRWMYQSPKWIVILNLGLGH